MIRQSKINLKEYLTTEHNGKEVLSFVEEEYHENFGFQWTKFNKLQLDSFNGSTESKDRLLSQSELNEEDFKNKIILEVGAGNGRFTEVLLKFGAKVIAVDYSSAIYVNHQNHIEKIESGELLCVRADVFNLPIKESVFDIVICYGVIQHTGDNLRCLKSLSSYVGSRGLLLIDIYSNSFKHYNPWIYLIRPLFSRIKSDSYKMHLVEKFISFVFPIQLSILKYLKNKQSFFVRYLKYFTHRSPNSVYGINLFLDNKISLENAKNWSICDTYDAWSPKHDDPVSFKKWNQLLNILEEKYNFSIRVSKECGQGNCALLKKKK